VTLPPLRGSCKVNLNWKVTIVDPNVTLRELLDALLELRRSGSIFARGEAIELLEDLADWFRKGGFAPSTAKIIMQLCEDLCNG